MTVVKTSNFSDKSWELVNFCEFDKYATQAYCSIHGVDESLNLGDITKVDETEIADFNMICGGSPCFVEGTLVLTEKDYKPIEEIEVGDRVLTHNNHYKKVVKRMVNEAKSIYKVDTMPSESIYVTDEHPFYIRRRYKEWNNTRRMYDRKFSNPEWVEAMDLDRDCYVGTAINRNSKIPIGNNNLAKYFNTVDFWYLIGRYIGDGWIKNSNSIIICGNKSEVGQILEVANSLKLKTSIYKERTVNKVYIYADNIGTYCEQFGKGAANKHLTSDIFDLPVRELQSFMDGYIAADGSFTQNMYKITTVSRELIYGVGQCVAKAYNRPFSIYFTQRPKTCEIEGRTVNQKDTYQITYKTESNTQDKAFYEDGYVWSPVNDVNIKEYDGLVYNIEVEDDNSYVVQNLIVHNCQDFSVAGKQKGSTWTCKMCKNDDGDPFEWNPLTVHYTKRHKCPHCGSENIDKSRSSLLVEYLRVICGNKPSFGIYENVKNIVGKKFKDTFKMFTDELEEYGYSLHWKVLNAKDYGIPQNRERVYLIFIKKELDNGLFKFPEPFDNGIRLKDVLEDDVDEKYYISEDKVKRFLTSLNNKDSLLYDACQVKREGKARECNDYCPTLTASDYKDPRLVNDNQIKQLADIVDNKIIDPQGRKTKKCIPKDVSPTLRAESHGNLPQVIQVGNIVDTGNWDNPQRGRIYSPDGCSPSLNTCGGGGLEPKIIQVGKLNSSQDGVVVNENGISPTHTAGHGNTPKVMQLGNVNPSGNGMNGQVYGTEGLAPTVTTNKGEGNKIAIKQATKQGYIECEIGGVADLSYPNSKTRRGRVQADGNISPTITATETGICKIESAIRIRKLIPLETFRLMGFTDEAFYKAMIGLNDLAVEFIQNHPYLIGKTILDEATTIQGISNSQLYKMSGNSIVVDVLYYIMVELYKAMPYLFDDLKLSSFFSGIGAFEIALDRLYEGINTGNFTCPQVD